MKRLRIRITKLDGPRPDGSTHHIEGGLSRSVRIEQTMPIDVRTEGRRSTYKRPLEALLKKLVAVRSVPSILPAEADALGQALGELMWQEKAPELEELWIETDDPLVAGLPWPLASTPSSDSLIAQEIPVVVQVGDSLQSAGLPPTPTLLFLAPNYEGDKATGWKRHKEALEEAIGGLCTIVPFHPTNEADIARALAEHAPDIVYYFGHGEMKAKIFYLDLGGTQCTAERLATLLSARLRDGTRIHEHIALLYLNCCWGGVSTEFGGPFKFAGLVPAFVSNRAAALNDAAQRQALTVLTEIVGNSVPPHEAVRNAVYGELTRTGDAAGTDNLPNEPWWLTLTIFARYSEWRRPKPKRFDRILSFEETLEIDRVNHWAILDNSLKRGQSEALGPRILMAVWHGEGEDGLHSLGERLCLQVLGGFRACHLAIREVAWPSNLYNVDGAQREKLIRDAIHGAVCGAGAGEGAVARKARDLLRPASGVAVLRQAPLDEEVLPADKRGALEDILLDYASVLDQNVRVLADPPPVLLVALLRIAGTDSEIARAIRRARTRNRTRVEIISMPPLGPVEVDDIQAFLQRLAIERKDIWDQSEEIAETILREHAGRYEPTRAQLANIEKFIGISRKEER